VDAVLAGAGVDHVAHGVQDPAASAQAAVADAAAVALIGPFFSTAVAEAVEVTAPAGLAVLAPVATWVGVTRRDEPAGDDDPPDARGTVLRMVARDSEVARRIAGRLRGAGHHAFVIAGEHPYGAQLQAQLDQAGIPAVDDVGEADVIVLCGLADGPETREAAGLPAVPVIAFDGIQGAAFDPGHDVQLALPFAPVGGYEHPDLFAGVERTRAAAALVVDAVGAGLGDRDSVLAAMRERGGFDNHGDPVDPPVWLWRRGPDWTLTPVGPLG
jgi:hypothetical protein